MLSTQHLDANRAGSIDEAARLLRAGRLVAFATETVYGLGANALDPVAVAAIFAAKQRPAWDPLIVHLADTAQLAQITEVPVGLQPRIDALTSAFWPGPLTLLLPRTDIVPDAVTAGRPLVGVRIPAHEAARSLLRAAGVPIAAPSANRFGHTSPTTAAHVLADLDGRIDAVFAAGPTSVGVESTVLDPTQTPMVLYRPGAITPAQLTAATGIEVVVYVPPEREATPPEALPSPGVGIRHYAPEARVLLVESEGQLQSTAREARAAHERVGLLLPDDWPSVAGTSVVRWGAWQDLDALAHNLFAGLRELDAQGLTCIIVPLPPPRGLGAAIRDRLAKAARTE